MRIIYNQSNCILLLLITAFITMPWAASHIHLSEKHHHNEFQHKHNSSPHSHSLTQQNIESFIDFSHHISHENIITLEYEYQLSKKEKQKSPSVTLIFLILYLLPQFFLSRIKIPTVINTCLSYFERSTVKPRAPPKTY